MAKQSNPTPTYSRAIALEPRTSEAFPDDNRNSREAKEQAFIFDKIMGVVMNGHNKTISISDVFSVASTLPISLSAARSMFDAWTDKAVADKKIKPIKSLFAEDGKLFEKLC